MMTKYKPYHLHSNPKKGRNQPLFILVEGFTCEKCQQQKKDSKRSKRLILQ